ADVVRGLATGEPCEIAEEGVERNGGQMSDCRASLSEQSAYVAVDVGIPGPLPKVREKAVAGTGRAHSSTVRSRRSAASLSKGSLPFPHFGGCTQDGHPSMHSQAAMADRVADSQSSMTSLPRSATPAPPASPS